MATRVLSWVCVFCVSLLIIFYLAWPQDPLFYIISGHPLLAAAKLSLVSGAVLLSYKKSFYTSLSKGLALAIALILLSFGALGVESAWVSNGLGGVVMPLDYLLALALGIIYLVPVLEYPTLRKLSLKQSISYELEAQKQRLNKLKVQVATYAKAGRPAR